MKRFALLFVLLAGCPPSRAPGDNGARCGVDQKPPPQVADVGTLLLEGMPEACPRAQPRVGDACAMPKVVTTNAPGESNYAECMYRRPEQNPCAYDSCTCVKSAEGVTWSCSSVLQ